ncbi:MAG TPA: hypothetical protein ACFYEH_08810, partial [Candidatus Brocadiaceae bacterium]
YDSHNLKPTTLKFLYIKLGYIRQQLFFSCHSRPRLREDKLQRESRSSYYHWHGFLFPPA